MRDTYPPALRVAVLCALGFLQGCGWGGPAPPTPEQTLKADTQTQESMRAHYGNMIGDKAKPKSKRPTRER